jgi:16S rRNA (guanine966-N2)-methyltransferase
VVFERGRDDADEETPGFERLDAREYGAARVLFLRYWQNGLDPPLT